MGCSAPTQTVRYTFEKEAFYVPVEQVRKIESLTQMALVKMQCKLMKLRQTQMIAGKSIPLLTYLRRHLQTHY